VIVKPPSTEWGESVKQLDQKRVSKCSSRTWRAKTDVPEEPSAGYENFVPDTVHWLVLTRPPLAGFEVTTGERQGEIESGFDHYFPGLVEEAQLAVRGKPGQALAEIVWAVVHHPGPDDDLSFPLDIGPAGVRAP
jgi:hypothetical protein